MSKFLWGTLAPACWVLVFLPTASAESRSGSLAGKAETETVELFDAIKAGDIAVKVIPKDEAAGKVVIENKTKRPLAIRLPEVFVAAPVAAQIFGAPGANGFPGVNDGNGQLGQAGAQNQPVGGGFNNQGGANGRQANGNGNFNGGIFKVEPEKVGRLKFTTVCLAHGKPTPNPHIEYQLLPVESFTSNAKTVETLKMLARGEIDQKSAQALAWRYENGKSWSELGRLVGARHLNGRSEGMFTAGQLAKAKKLAGEVEKRASANHRTDDKRTSLALEQ